MILVVLLILWIYVLFFDHPKGEILRPLIQKMNFKTGDIILFHALDNINPLFFGTYYTHIGVIYKKGDQLLLFEAANPNREILLGSNSRGIILCDLETRLRTYRGYILYKELNMEVPLAAQQQLDTLIEYAVQNCYYNPYVIGNFIDKMVFGDNIHHGLNCGELVYLALVALGILPKKYFEENRKHHIRWLSRLGDIETGYSYADPKYIYYDPFSQTDHQNKAQYSGTLCK